MPNIKPIRDYSEHEVVNLFTIHEDTSKGTFVTAVGAGFNFKTDSILDDNAEWLDGTVSARFNVPHRLTAVTSGATKGTILGMTLKSVASVDENGYPLKFEPRKAAEMDVLVSGQAVPVLTKGVVLYNGIDGTPGFGSGAAISDTVPGALKVVTYANATVGKFLGPKNDEGYALLKIEL